MSMSLLSHRSGVDRPHPLAHSSACPLPFGSGGGPV